MTTPSSTPTTKTVTAGVKTTPGWTGWTWVVFFVFIIIVFIFSGSGKSKEKKPGKDKSKSEITWVWVVTKSVTISINGEYSAIYYLSKGEGLSLKNSTQPYCVENENRYSLCGEKGEDVTPRLPKEYDNMRLKFRTSNGENGEITLVYWEKIIASNK